jgi:hypothetical protein
MRTLTVAGVLLGMGIVCAQWNSPALGQPAPAVPKPSVPGSGAPAGSPDLWVPRGTAELVALDKVRAVVTPLHVKVGTSATFHSLTIAVKACDVRPPDAAPDAVAFLQITDSAKGAPGFDGWVLASAPSLSFLQHPIYDIRVVGCRA